MFGVNNNGNNNNQIDLKLKTSESKPTRKLELIPMTLLSNLDIKDSIEKIDLGSKSSLEPILNYPFLDEIKSNLEENSEIEKLKKITPKELKILGQKSPGAFLKALLPAALESEKRYGVPIEVTLAQAAIESGWGKSPIGYNIFGMKGSGTAGSIKVNTAEYIHGKKIIVKANFANYHNFYEAVVEHGECFTGNKKYVSAVNQYSKDKNLFNFVDNIAKTYATSPKYGKAIKATIATYNIHNMADEARKASFK